MLGVVYICLVISPGFFSNVHRLFVADTYAKPRVNMKLPIVCHALSVLSLWASTGAAQLADIRVAVKLTPAALDKQKADPNFIANWFKNPQRTGFAPPKLTVGSLVDPKRTADLAGRIRTANVAAFQAPNFEAWFQIKLDAENQPRDINDLNVTSGGNGPGLSTDTLNLIHTLSKFPEVESVHALQPGPPPAVNPNDDPRSTNQGYLNAAPQGINARYAWGFTGGDGAGSNIVDVEQGWKLDHEDLVGHITGTCM